MSLMERISHDMTAAMRARDAQRLGPLRMAKAALMNREDATVPRAIESSTEASAAWSARWFRPF